MLAFSCSALVRKSIVKSRLHSGVVAWALMLSAFLPRAAWARDEQKWLQIHTAHFSVLTDAGEKRGREVALRMEQMRAVFGELLSKEKLNMSVPVTVIALKGDNQYGAIAPDKLTFAK